MGVSQLRYEEEEGECVCTQCVVYGRSIIDWPSANRNRKLSHDTHFVA